MFKFLRGIVAISLSVVFVGCAMDTDRQGAETNPTPTNIANPTKEVPSKYVDRNRVNRVATPITPTSPSPTNPTGNIPRPGNSYNVRAADKIAHFITNLPEVKTATAVRMGQHAYVAAVLNGGENKKLTDSLKKKISDRARQADSSLRNVYVSINPDFYKQLNGYADDLRAGRPVQGLVNRLQDLVDRTFPEAR